MWIRRVFIFRKGRYTQLRQRGLNSTGIFKKVHAIIFVCDLAFRGRDLVRAFNPAFHMCWIPKSAVFRLFICLPLLLGMCLSVEVPAADLQCVEFVEVVEMELDDETSHSPEGSECGWSFSQRMHPRSNAVPIVVGVREFSTAKYKEFRRFLI